EGLDETVGGRVRGVARTGHVELAQQVGGYGCGHGNLRTPSLTAGRAAALDLRQPGTFVRTTCLLRWRKRGQQGGRYKFAWTTRTLPGPPRCARLSPRSWSATCCRTTRPGTPPQPAASPRPSCLTCVRSRARKGCGICACRALPPA